MATDNSVVAPRVSRALTWLLALGLLMAGVYLSHIRFLHSEWLSRAGCLIVMLGIWSSLGAILHERIVAGRLRGRRRNAIVQARAELAEQEVDDELIEKSVDKINENFARQQAAHTEQLKLSFGVLEVSLLLTGTFVWGFGDLIARWV